MDEERPPFRYDARLAGEIELRWQERWEREGTFRAANPSGALSDGFADEAARPKFYLLDFFPYPSGIGLHVGHPLGYIGTDVFGRYLTMTGHHVLHPFGFDTFGLPAEQYAIDTGQHPAVTVRQNAAVMRRQLRRLGLGGKERVYFELHATLDVRHSEAWNREVIHSLVAEDPDTALPIAEGALLRLRAGARCFDRYRRALDGTSL